jgi:hypothetical protein
MNEHPAPNASGPLKELGPISHSVERAFFYMHEYSLAQLWLKESRYASSEKYHRGIHKPIEKQVALKNVRSRSQRVERYMLFWLVLELILCAVGIVAGKVKPAWWPDYGILEWASIVGFILIPAYRVLEIVQSVVNINLLDPVRREGGMPNYVASVPRMVILGIWNWLEVAICFAIFYGSSWATFVYGNTASQTTGHGLYFSVITQLTIGYGDVSPTHATQLAAATQGLIGFLLGIIMLSRIIAFLPGLIGVAQTTSTKSANLLRRQKPIRRSSRK